MKSKLNKKIIKSVFLIILIVLLTSFTFGLPGGTANSKPGSDSKPPNLDLNSKGGSMFSGQFGAQMSKAINDVLSFLFSSDITKSQVTKTEVLFVKVLLFFMLFAIILSALQLINAKRKGANKSGIINDKASKVVALVIALISAKFMPDRIVAYIITTYVTVAAAFLTLVPILSMHYLLITNFPYTKKDKDGKVIKKDDGSDDLDVMNIIIHSIAWVVTVTIFFNIKNSDMKALAIIGTWGLFIGIIALIANLARLGGAGIGSDDSDGEGGFFSNLFGGGDDDSVSATSIKNAHDKIDLLNEELTERADAIERLSKEIKRKKDDLKKEELERLKQELSDEHKELANINKRIRKLIKSIKKLKEKKKDKESSD